MRDYREQRCCPEGVQTEYPDIGKYSSSSYPSTLVGKAERYRSKFKRAARKVLERAQEEEEEQENGGEDEDEEEDEEDDEEERRQCGECDIDLPLESMEDYCDKCLRELNGHSDEENDDNDLSRVSPNQERLIEHVLEEQS